MWAVVLTTSLVLAIVIVSVRNRRSANTAEFYLAGRQVGLLANASAICGDYFSAASFLGVAGAVYASGLDGLWFGAGFGAGFIPVLLFFASPIRRFGEYTLPDFLAARFQSSTARVAGVIAVQAVALSYLAPQMLGAGTTWEVLVGRGVAGLDGYSTGVVVTAVLMAFYVGLGGMRGTTWNQMVQFWVLLSAIGLVVLLGLGYGFSYARALADVSRPPLTVPTAFTVRDLLTVDPRTGERPADAARRVMSETYWKEKIAPRLQDPEAPVVVLMPQRSQLTGEVMRFNQAGHRYGWLDQFSVVLTLVLGTSGLPHIMNRFYTNPTGRVARLTTVYVLGFASLFYMLASMVGVVGRDLVPGLVAAGGRGAVDQAVGGVLVNSDAIVPFLGQTLGGSFGLGYVAAGAFAAMFSTIGGLLMASAASWGHDLYEQFLEPDAPEWKRIAVGRLAVVFMSTLALAVGLGVRAMGLTRAYPALIAQMVTWAFAISGSSFVPVLATAIWWKRTTLRGALAGLLVGGLGSVGFIMLNILRVTSSDPAYQATGWYKAGMLTYPTVITAPLAFGVVVAVSSLDRKLPGNINEIWVRIHGTARERAERGGRE